MSIARPAAPPSHCRAIAEQLEDQNCCKARELRLTRYCPESSFRAIDRAIFPAYWPTRGTLRPSLLPWVQAHEASPHRPSEHRCRVPSTTNRPNDYFASLLRELCALPRETEWLEFKRNAAKPHAIGYLLIEA